MPAKPIKEIRTNLVVHTKGNTLINNLRIAGRANSTQLRLIKQIDDHPYRHVIKLNWLMELVVRPRNKSLFERSQAKTRGLEAVLAVLDTIKYEVEL